MSANVFDLMMDALQWPAMVATLIAAWQVGSKTRTVRRRGFWWFIVSNILWSVWGAYTGAYAMIVLQVGLFILNIRGAHKNESPKSQN